MSASRPPSLPATDTVTPGSFREVFPALVRQAWLDTPASAPGAMPVTAALASAIGGWQDGSVGAADWEAAAPRARAGFARYLGVPEAHVALMGSVAEAAATVAAPAQPAGAARCDTSPAWLSWVGAEAAIALLSALPAAAVERHCLGLAAGFRDAAREVGVRPVTSGPPSHIVTVRVGDPDAVSARLQSGRVRAWLLGDRLRVGFHYFNNDEDVEAAVGALGG